MVQRGVKISSRGGEPWARFGVNRAIPERRPRVEVSAETRSFSITFRTREQNEREQRLHTHSLGGAVHQRLRYPEAATKTHRGPFHVHVGLRSPCFPCAFLSDKYDLDHGSWNRRNAFCKQIDKILRHCRHSLHHHCFRRFFPRIVDWREQFQL